MEFTLAGEADIGFVRRQLDDLVVIRSLYGWSEVERDRYKQLCACERSLLYPSIPHEVSALVQLAS
jgi:hypothetical protein